MRRMMWAALAGLAGVGLLIFALFSSSPVVRADTQAGGGWSECFASEQLTVSTTAVGLTAATYAPTTGRPAAQYALITHDGTANNVRFLFDGTAPTTTRGHRLANTAGIAKIELYGTATLRRFLAIREGGTDVPLDVTYCR